MTVNYDLTEEDLVDYNVHFAKTVGQLEKSKRALIVLGVVMMALGAFVLALGKVVIGISSLLYGVILMGLSPLLQKSMRRNLKKVMQKGYFKAILGETQVTLTPKGIQTTNRMSESLMYWGAVEQLAETETHFFVQFSAGINLVIPKRAFATQTHGAQFLQRVEEYRQAATGTPIPTMQRGSWWTQGTQVVEPQSQRQ
jgi:hypothetical protein